jgi:phage terminase large subunit-like protein
MDAFELESEALKTKSFIFGMIAGLFEKRSNIRKITTVTVLLELIQERAWD